MSSSEGACPVTRPGMLLISNEMEPSSAIDALSGVILFSPHIFLPDNNLDVLIRAWLGFKAAAPADHS